jgi:flagellar basal-body rod protein FlgF/flagellar basal-body rod protein FlgG
MPYGLYISAEGAQAQSRRVEIIANNLANVDTLGFKRELAICQARYAESIEQGLESPGAGSIDDIGGGIMVRQTKADYSPGPVRRTENPSDVAIEGEGFFAVRKGDETLLTRAGNFRITSTGELVTQQGYSVLSDAGTPIVVNPGNGPWEITTTGGVRQRDGSPQNLALVKPASYNDLTKVGENLFRATDQTEPLPPADRRVAAGYVELSAVRPTVEMTALIEASRLLEANVNLMKAQDEMLAGLINRVLKA